AANTPTTGIAAKATAEAPAAIIDFFILISPSAKQNYFIFVLKHDPSTSSILHKLNHIVKLF
ncbi:hypothetical protein IKF02_03230, partial [Candidatus Saccharibacteria bacterium]|nr:hypothetical protein [Candidatus Saccharibacteria bacterium]